jgi:hypothetical protein
MTTALPGSEGGQRERAALWTIILIAVNLPEEFLKFLRETIHFTPSIVEALPAEKPQGYITKKHTKKQT